MSPLLKTLTITDIKTYDNETEDHKHVNWPLYVFITHGYAADAMSAAFLLQCFHTGKHFTLEVFK